MFSNRVKRFQRFLIPLGFLVVFMGAAPVAEIRLERKVVGPGGVETEDIGVRLSPEKLEFYKWLNLGEPGALVVNAGIYSTGGQWELDGIHGTAGGFDIGGTLSAQAATISGNLTLSGHLQPSTTSLWNLGSSSKRWVTVYAMAVDTPSDRRLKRDIEDLDYGLEELMKMRPVSYQWKEHPEKGRQLGLIAQDLQ
ncbi:MAG: tail fiber domain-containing protein, partial [Candidatus Krumholzibacteriota bacterium]